MNLRSILQSLCVVALMAAAPASHAVLLTFDTLLTGAEEFPPVATPGSGTGRVEVDTVLRTMRLEVSFANLLGLTTASHIHCCTFPGANAPVATQVPTFVGFPLGVTSGTYLQVFDMTLASSYNPAFITAQGGSALTAFDALVLNMLAGRTYLNIHTNLFPGGEIRGQLRKVPEPGTLALFAIAGIVLVARRRRTG